ncbi:MAG: alpha/beta hydrolase [Hyphomicrobiaceae bacterium]
MSVSVTRCVWALCIALTLLTVGASVSAETIIQKVENKSLKGAAYARLRNLSYQQCEQRCLKEARCVAIEHYRGGGFVRRSSNCALFSSVEKSADSKSSDIGFKRQSVAAAPSAPAPHAARRYHRSSPAAPAPQPRGGWLAGEQAGQGGARQAEASREADHANQAASRRAADDAARRAAMERAAELARRQEELGRAAETTARRSIGSARQAPTPSPSAIPGASRSIRGPAPTAAAPPPGVEASRSIAPGPADRFHIVPVYYGTDRNRIKQEGRFGYANDRAKRLEMGRALVSVPLDHKVPNIERPRAWTIPYIGTIQIEKEDANKHFTVREIKVLTKAELLELVKQRLGASRTFRDQSIVFIHGYNMSFDDALFRTAQISYDLQFDGAAFAYSWPSGGGLASYIYDRDSAQGAERYLYEFLQMVQNETGSQSINIIAHSMGNQMLLQVLRSLKLRAPQAVSKINQIILAAPDIDRDAFEGIAAEVTGIAKGITLYASANDRALEASRFVAGNKPRAGDVPIGGPVIVSGIDTIDISQLSTGYLALHHSGYAEHSELLTDIGQIIRLGTRPWSQRLKAYRPVTLQAGTYWRYEN